RNPSVRHKFNVVEEKVFAWTFFGEDHVVPKLPDYPNSCLNNHIKKLDKLWRDGSVFSHMDHILGDLMASLDRLPTRYNLDRRGVEVSSLSCPICNSTHEDTDHLLFRCGLATDVMRLVCRWWNVLWIPVNSYQEWIAWFKSLRMSSSSKGVLEGVFYTAWWSIWYFRNQLLFAVQKP
ncbi:RNA-directed DNA polymerase, eukaryota, partial [Tanacetum coccineum]